MQNINNNTWILARFPTYLIRQIQVQPTQMTPIAALSSFNDIQNREYQVKSVNIPI